MNRQLRQFKVVEVGAEENTLVPHVLLASDGQCWQVSLPSMAALQTGTTIRVPIATDTVQDCMPDWRVLGCEQWHKMVLRWPYRLVAAVWGEEIAAQNDVPVNSDGLLRPQLKPLLFDGADFEATPKTSAYDKADFANKFVRFALNGFRDEHLTGSLHYMLTQAFSLGPYNEFGREQFCKRHFSTVECRLLFVRRIARRGRYGGPNDPMQDVAHAISRWCSKYILCRIEQSAETVEAMTARRHSRQPDWRWPV